MNKRLLWAMSAYLALAVMATFTLDGGLRYFIWILMAGLAVKTWVAHKKTSE